MLRHYGFTLMELMVVVLIIGILSTLGIVQFFSSQDSIYVKEAIANLKMISASEKIYRMETSSYVNISNVSEVNSVLRLNLPTISEHWNYKVAGASKTAFTAKAGRLPDNSKVWCINQSQEEPIENKTGECYW